MAVSYKRLWKLLIDRDMKKKDLELMADISNYTISKLNRNKNINVSVLAKICSVLGCTMDDIVEVLPDQPVVDVALENSKDITYKKTQREKCGNWPTANMRAISTCSMKRGEMPAYEQYF